VTIGNSIKNLPLRVAEPIGGDEKQILKDGKFEVGFSGMKQIM
jgi:hypothetical protein